MRRIFWVLLLVGVSSVSSAQLLSGKKALKLGKKKAASGNWREAVNILSQSTSNTGKHSDELMLQLAISQRHILLLDSAQMSVVRVLETSDTEIKARAFEEKKLIAQQKKRYGFNLSLAKYYVAQKDFVTANMSLKQAIKYDTGNYELWLVKAEIVEATKSVQETVLAYEKTIHKFFSEKSQKAHVFTHLARTYLMLGENEKAVQAANKGLALSDTVYELNFQKARALFGMKKYEGAEQNLSIFLAHTDKFVGALKLRADCYFFMKRYGSAIIDYTEVISLDSTRFGAFDFRGRSYFYTKQYRLAESDFRVLDSVFTDNYYAKNAIGVCRYYQGDIVNAVMSFEEAVRLSSEEKYAFNLAMAYHKLGENEKGLKKMKTLAENNRYEPKYQLAVVRMLMDMNDYLYALSWINMAIKYNPYLKDYFFVRAEIYRNIGETAKAKKDERIAYSINNGKLNLDLEIL